MILAPIALAFALAETTAPHGTYVEARTAAVYAGACHFGGQYTTQGREAVLGWNFTSGFQGDVALKGVDLVVVVACTANLEVHDAKRRSVLYLDAGASELASAAAKEWLTQHHADLVGEVTAVKRAKVSVGRKGDTFWLRAGTDIELAGNAMPERECCKMSYNLWYEPLAPVTGRLVGNTTAFDVDEELLGCTWSRPGGNDAFFGAF